MPSPGLQKKTYANVMCASPRHEKFLAAWLTNSIFEKKYEHDVNPRKGELSFLIFWIFILFFFYSNYKVKRTAQTK